MTPKTPYKKTVYEWARRKALQELSRRHRDEYLTLVERYRGRPVSTEHARGRLGVEVRP